MSAWGYSLFDNDPALDVKYRWEVWVDGPDAVGFESALDRFFKYWGSSSKYGDFVTNSEIIALVGIYIDKGLEIPKKLQKACVDAINRELEKSALENWQEPQKREEALLELLKRIGGKRKPPKHFAILKDPALEYGSIEVARKRLLETVKMALKKDPYSASADIKFPPFIETLSHQMNSRIWEKDYKVWELAQTERLMMIACYLGIRSKMSLEEVTALLDKVAGWNKGK